MMKITYLGHSGFLAETDDSADDTDGGTGESDGDSASAVGGYSMAQVSEYRIIPGRPEQETDGGEYGISLIFSIPG